MRASSARRWPATLHAAVVVLAAAASVWRGGPGLLAQGHQALVASSRDASWRETPLAAELRALSAAMPADLAVQVVLTAPDPEVLATYMAISYWLLPRPSRPALSLDVLAAAGPCRHAVVLAPQVPVVRGWRTRAQRDVPPWTLTWLERDAR